MYKLSVPVSINTLTDADLPLFAETLLRAGTNRVFLYGFLPPNRKDSLIYSIPNRIRYLITNCRKYEAVFAHHWRSVP